MFKNILDKCIFVENSDVKKYVEKEYVSFYIACFIIRRVIKNMRYKNKIRRS